MKALIALLIVFFNISVMVAQQPLDSLSNRTLAFTDKLDSIPTKVALPDSLLNPYRRVDSIRNEFNNEASSLKGEYDSVITSLANQKSSVQDKIDSLQRLNLPTSRYTRKLDSLNNIQSAQTQKLNSKLSDLKSKTTGKLDALDLPPQYKEPVQSLTSNVNNVSLDGAAVNVPGVEIPGFKMPDLQGVSNLDINSTNIPGLPSVQTPVGDLGQVGQELQGVQSDVKAIANGDLSDAQNIPKTLESKAVNIDGVAELQEATGTVNEYQSKVEALSDPEAAKKEAAQMAKQKAIDHFAGKQEQLKAAMDKMAKYKQKYSSVSSIKDLSKRKPNAMRGKPFIERLIPGLYFQYQQKTFNLFDFNPYVGYRISGRFTAGAGWNQRFAYDPRKEHWNTRGRIFGPRVFVDFNIGKGFIAHIEGETMNTFVPSVISGSVLDQGHREWVWGMQTGLKKEYKIYKNLRGTVLIQYNIFNPNYTAPYVDRLNSRIGVEWLMKKKTSR